jgi:hypothetical protein
MTSKERTVGFILEIDGAVSLSDADIKKIPDDTLITLYKNDEYRYCFVPTAEQANGIHHLCWCSKDGKEWVTCVTAFIGNDSIDLYTLRDRLIEAEPDDDLQKIIAEEIERKRKQ